MRGQSWIEIGHLDDIPRRGDRRVSRPRAAVPIAVFRAADDSVFALIDRCPHRAGPLSEGIVQGCAVACPLHGWVIDLRSGRAEEPDEGHVPTVPVRLVERRIFLSALALEVVDAVVRRTR
jgi:nitrite reductase (NADH) small subunit